MSATLKSQRVAIYLFCHMQIRKKSFVVGRRVGKFELALGMNAGVYNTSETPALKRHGAASSFFRLEKGDEMYWLYTT